jgi:hypothetical protein
MESVNICSSKMRPALSAILHRDSLNMCAETTKSKKKLVLGNGLVTWEPGSRK